MHKKKKIWLSVSLILFLILIVTALEGSHWIHHAPFKPDMRNAFLKPCLEYPFGTDNLGRCVFCRIIAGSKTSVFSALFVVIIVLGIIAGFAGGVWENVIMKVTLIFQAFPSFILAVAIAGILGNGVINGVLSLCAVYWTTKSRLARSLTVSLRNVPYMKAAKICGASRCSILFRYILPNVMPSLLVTAAMDVGSVILSMAGLSFLGLGAVRPTAEWGAVMSEAKDYLQTAPWIIIFNGIALFVVVTVFNLLGDSLRDVLDTEAEM